MTGEQQVVIEPSVVQDTQVTSPKKKRGCWFWGCIGCSGFALLLLIALAIGAWWAWKHAHRFAVEWSSETPLEMRDVALSGDTVSLLQDREKLEDALEYGGSGTYVIDQDMIDAQLLTQGEEQLIDIMLASGEVVFSMSIPLEKLEIAELSSRYLNVQARGTFDYDAGKIQAYILDVEVPGKHLPAGLVNELRSENIGPYLYREEEFVKFIQQFERITLGDNEVELVFGE